MKLHADHASDHSIQAHGDGWVQIGGQRFNHSVLVDSATGVHSWPVTTTEALTAQHFEAVLPLGPEVVIHGSGLRLRFPPPSSLQPLVRAQVGMETMSTAAACRTFNVLAQEGRRVVAALLIEAAKS